MEPNIWDKKNSSNIFVLMIVVSLVIIIIVVAIICFCTCFHKKEKFEDNSKNKLMYETSGDIDVSKNETVEDIYLNSYIQSSFDSVMENSKL